MKGVKIKEAEAESNYSQVTFKQPCSRDPVLRYNAQRVETWIRVNDPSAGSPTETLLRLLLPLNDQV
jgi:hypothetical protein